MENRIWNFTEEESQDLNDRIMLFMGGVVEPTPFGGEVYRFPDGVVPPMNVLPRADQGGTRIMMMHYNITHLFGAIDFCNQKALKNEELYKTYLSIGEELVVYSYDIRWAQRKLINFIEQYEKLSL